jgi:hypothetical protein
MAATCGARLEADDLRNVLEVVTGKPAGECEEDVVARKWWVLITVSVPIFMLLLDVTAVNVALPDIQRSLH